MNDDSARSVRLGALYGVAAYLIWGLLPLFFRLLEGVPPAQILAHRILWSFALVCGTTMLLGRGRLVIATARDARTMRLLVVSALLIGFNWLAYIWAVLHGHVLAASLGYFINPLLNVGLGIVVLGERLRRAQAVAIGMAAVGVTALAARGGADIWISLGLAFSFAGYGIIRKIAPVDALGGLTIETLVLSPPALLFLLWAGWRGESVFGADRGHDLLLLASALITAAPLLLFTAAAKRMRYATLGLFQYIAPTLQFLCAVLVFGEHATATHIFTFTCIWAGLALYAVDGLRPSSTPPIE